MYVKDSSLAHKNYFVGIEERENTKVILIREMRSDILDKLIIPFLIL